MVKLPLLFCLKLKRLDFFQKIGRNRNPKKNSQHKEQMSWNTEKTWRKNGRKWKKSEKSEADTVPATPFPEIPTYSGGFSKTPGIGNENAAQSFSDRSFWKSSLGSWTSAPSGHGCPHPNACFSSDFEGPERSFGPGCTARMAHGCPRDILPQNFLFGLLFRSWW